MNRLLPSLALALLLSPFFSARPAPYAGRENRVVAAVRSTRESIVVVRVKKHGAYSTRTVSGAGVIVDARGYVLTNRHVIDGGEDPTVALVDAAPVAVDVLFTDAVHDLAVLKLPKGTYRPIPFAPAGDALVGETVIAVGHPYGYTNSVSTGIVSALHREIDMPDGPTLTDMIQTTASINPGNSGGPLLNINGELIGVNSAMRADAQGVAFALTSDVVRQVLREHKIGDFNAP